MTVMDGLSKTKENSVERGRAFCKPHPVSKRASLELLWLAGFALRKLTMIDRPVFALSKLTSNRRSHLHQPTLSLRSAVYCPPFFRFIFSSFFLSPFFHLHLQFFIFFFFFRSIFLLRIRSLRPFVPLPDVASIFLLPSFSFYFF